ncbi:hypothetical protein CAPTEDRAFT_195973 [Capitella teleta]|uniref:BACK domain-containing protein n=1 Tax=Capitella teleta TaxID=283909 RepID=R7TCJ2_CAPTE|nr:hypothetical protein CAPTEDRAFT_195973 [Capitella teleta]|eukprot:ELT91232.1 hypothetical protein CAPTEDRAFT_195973 [Capitella teleta]
MSVELSPENILPLLILYDKYLVKEHKEVCVQYMTNNVNISNAVSWYKFALDFSMHEVMLHCQQVICANFAELSQDRLFVLDVDALQPLLLRSELVVRNEKFIVDFIFEWLLRRTNASDELRKTCLVDLLRCTRLQYLTPKELFELETKPDVKAIMPKVIDKFNQGLKFCLYGSLVCGEESEDTGFRIYTSKDHLLLTTTLMDAHLRPVIDEPRRHAAHLTKWDTIIRGRVDHDDDEVALKFLVEMWRAVADETQPDRVDMNLCPKTNITANSLTFKVVTIFHIVSPACFPDLPDNSKTMVGSCEVKKFFRSLYGTAWVPLNIQASRFIPAEHIMKAKHTEVSVYMNCLNKTG